MAISFVSWTMSPDRTMPLPPGWAARDLAIGIAALYIDAAATSDDIAEVPAGWTDLGAYDMFTEQYPAELHNLTARLACRFLEAGDINAGTWGSEPVAGFVHGQVVAYRGVHQTTPIGNLVARKGLEDSVDGGNSPVFGALAAQVAGKSWLLAIGAQRVPTLKTHVISGLTTRSSGSAGADRPIVMADSNGSFTMWPKTTLDTAGGGNRPWLTWAIELRAEEQARISIAVAGRSPVGPTPPPVNIPGSALSMALTFPAGSPVAGEPSGGGGGGPGQPHPTNINPVRRIPPPRAGYVRRWYTDFPNFQAQIGPPHPDTLAVLRASPEGSWDSSDRGMYSWARTSREHDSVLDIWLHTEMYNQTTRTHVANPSGTMRVGPDANPGEGSLTGAWVNLVSRPLPQANRQLIQDVSWVMKYPQVDGRKMANLMWAGPGVGDPGYAENDFPEGHLIGGNRGNAFYHLESSKEQRSAFLSTNLQAWHLYSMRFHAKGANGHPTGYVEFWLDGVRVAGGNIGNAWASNDTVRIPGRITLAVTPNSMFFALQIETLLKKDTIPRVGIQEGHCLVDEIAVDVPA